MKEKISKNLTRIVFFGLLAVMIIVIVFATINSKPEIVFFFLATIFLLTFMYFGMKILVGRIQFLKSSDALSAKILNKNLDEIEVPNQHFYNNAMYFHIFLIVLIMLNLILSYFNLGVYEDSYYERFYDDLVFQFNVAILFTILGFLNPFLEIPDAIKNTIKEGNNKLYDFISNKNKLFYSRLLLCILVFLLFIYKDWLVFPNFLNENLIMLGIDISLVLFVIFNIYRMIRYAKNFLAENIFRVVKSFTIFTSALFVLVPLVPLTMVLLYAFNIDESKFHFVPIPFIGFNLIMVYVESSLNSKTKAQKLKE